MTKTTVKTTKTLLTNDVRLHAVSLAFRRFEDFDAVTKERDLIQTATEMVAKDLKKAATKRELDVLRAWGQTRTVNSWGIEALPIKIEGTANSEYATLPMYLKNPKHADSRDNWKPQISTTQRGGGCMNHSHQSLYVCDNVETIKFGQDIEVPAEIGRFHYRRNEYEKIAFVWVRNGKYSTNSLPTNLNNPPATPFTYSEATIKAVDTMVRHGHDRWHQKMKMMQAAVDLIAKCKTLEELEVSWPEAKELRKHVITNLPAPIMASNFNLLLENMKQRGVKLAA